MTHDAAPVHSPAPQTSEAAALQSPSIQTPSLQTPGLQNPGLQRVGRPTGTSRRTLLGASTVAASGACALLLAGCSGSDEANQAAGSTPQPITSDGAPVRVGKLSEIAIGETARGKAGDKNIVLYRASETKVSAYTDVCTHAGCQIAPSGAEFKCPCHGSVFNGSDGTVLEGPARKSLARYAVTIDGEWIMVSA